MTEQMGYRDASPQYNIINKIQHSN